MPGTTFLRPAAIPAATTAGILAGFALSRFAASTLEVSGPLGRLLELIELVLAISICFSLAWLTATLVGLALARNAGNGARRPKLTYQLVSTIVFAAAAFLAVSLLTDGSLLGAVASSGIAIAILGISLRNVAADIFAGIALSLERSFRLSDWIEIEDGIAGRVVEINWRATRIETRDRIHIIVPNGQLARDRITNYSTPSRRYRHQIEITLDHSVPVDVAKSLLLQAAIDAPGILSTPEPDVRIKDYAPNGLIYVVRFWVLDYVQEVDCRDAVLSNFDRLLRSNAIAPPHLHHRFVAVGPGDSIALQHRREMNSVG